MAKRKTKAKRSRKPIGFKKVDFFSGLKTDTKDDDKQVSFIARNRGKNSPLELPSIAGIGRMPRKKKQKLGQAEIAGFKFDDGFGLSKKGGKGVNPFASKIGIDKNFGIGKFDVGFSKAFVNQDFDFGDSTMISDDFEEPTERNVLGDVDQINDNADSQNVFGGDSVPTLLDSVESLGDAERIPKTDDDGMSREEKLEKKFLRVRQEALDTGSNPLSPEEAQNFEQVKAQRNFGTTGKGRASGGSFGRF